MLIRIRRAPVERMFDAYGNRGLGAHRVAAELNDVGFRTRTGRRWTHKTVLDILRNRAYLGKVYFRGKWYRSSETPFVDPALFDRVQALLDERGEGYRSRFGHRESDYLLTGVLKCGRCGKGYVGAVALGKLYCYYV